MHSSNAACVFGDARLISSTSSRFAKTGPGRNSNSFERWLKTLTPVTSDGSRSGELQPRERSFDRARERLCERRLPHSRQVLDDQVALRQQTEDGQLQCLVGRMNDAAEVRDDAPDRLVGADPGRGAS